MRIAGLLRFVFEFMFCLSWHGPQVPRGNRQCLCLPQRQHSLLRWLPLRARSVTCLPSCLSLYRCVSVSIFKLQVTIKLYSLWFYKNTSGQSRCENRYCLCYITWFKKKTHQTLYVKLCCIIHICKHISRSRGWDQHDTYPRPRPRGSWGTPDDQVDPWGIGGNCNRLWRERRAQFSPSEAPPGGGGELVGAKVADIW